MMLDEDDLMMKRNNLLAYILIIQLCETNFFLLLNKTIGSMY